MRTMNMLLLCCFALLLAGSGCLKKPQASGGDTQLYVVADSLNWIELQPALQSAFQKVIETPQPEKVFELVWVPPRKFNEFATRKYMALLGLLESEGEISGKVAGMLSAEVKKHVEDGSAFYFPKENAWAQNQLLVVLAGTTAEELAQKLQENKNKLYHLFLDRLLAETEKQMFSQLEQKELSQTLLEKYGWMVRVQHDYVLNVERPDENFVMLRRSLPGRERWLFVHWVDDADPNVISESWALEKRNKLTRKFYQGDFVDEQYLHSEEVDFLGRPALMLYGLWRNDTNFVGGPFRTYVFYDEDSQRIYMIDLAVYYPAGKKEPFLRQLDIMAHTFKTINEVKEGS